MKRSKKLSVSKIIMGIILVFLAASMLIPMLNILAQSLSHPDKVHALKGWDILPKGFSLINFQVILGQPLVIRSILNSIFITVVGTFLNLVMTASAAYVLTRPGLVGKKIFMYFFIVMMIFEPGIIQEYFLMKDIHLLDSLFSMVFYKCVNVYYLIILIVAIPVCTFSILLMLLVFTPLLCRFLIKISPFPSSPTQPNISTSAPSLAMATA